MRSLVSSAFCSVLALAPAADEQTWTGRISDSACGAHHEEAAEGAGELSGRDCTLACVRGGSKYVLVTDAGAVLSIANQQFPGLAEHAAETVVVTGTLADSAITVTKIERR